MKKNYMQAFIFATLLTIRMPIGSIVYADEQHTTQRHETSMAPLLTMEQLSQTAMQCRHDIIQLHQQRSTVSQDKMREYSIALGIAADKCDAITHVFLKVQKASQDYAAYQEHLQKVQSLTSGLGTMSSEYNGK